jgi:hypothetical protein
MSFLAPDEYIVILDYSKFWQGSQEISPDDFLKLRDCGVQSVMCYINWHMIEPQRGVYDWSSIDSLVNPVLAAGMKAIVKVYAFQIPTFLPEAWYERGENGEVLNRVGVPDDQGNIPIRDSGSISYWHPDGWAYALGFVERACEHFDMPGVQCINIAPCNGEGLLFGGGKHYFDDAALASFRHYMGDAKAVPGIPTPGTPTLNWLRMTIIPRQVELQRIFVRYFGEYWTMLHHAFETIPETGNWLIDDLYYALKAELSPAEHWGLCYTVFRQGETRGLWGPEQDVKRHGVKMLRWGCAACSPGRYCPTRTGG